MAEYVLTTPTTYQNDPRVYQQDTPAETTQTTIPREYNRHTPAGSKNMPALVNNTMNTKTNKRMKGPVIRPLRSPPPEWKAKVDAGYIRHTPQYRTRKWRQQVHETGYESAPPEDLNYEDAEFVYGPEDGEGYVSSLHPSRADSRGEGPSTAAFYFNAKYQNKPRYYRRPYYITRDAFVTTPYAENDFNATAVGWSPAYADHY